jgi:Rps23 Pro-64 3,4-dihydroxylase Tpa1-like proline 4-hydroxylase
MKNKKKSYFTHDECKLIINYSEDYNDWRKITNRNFNSYFIKSINPPDFVVKRIQKYCEDEILTKVSEVKMLILKYEVGDYFKRHKDKNENILFNKDFLYNINLKLNDSFEGGQFFLKDKLFEANIGDVYCYKSTDFHEVMPVKSGVRYVALFYIKEGDLLCTKLI